MATSTTNYNLSKPSYSDTADIAVINENMDKIDTAIKSVSDTASTNATNISALQRAVSSLIDTGELNQSHDLNDFGSEGRYFWSGNKPANAPVDYAFLLVFAYGRMKVQICIYYSGDAYIRTWWDTDGWLQWKRLW